MEEFAENGFATVRIYMIEEVVSLLLQFLKVSFFACTYLHLILVIENSFEFSLEFCFVLCLIPLFHFSSFSWVYLWIFCLQKYPFQAAALFKVLKDTPPIPEMLSADGKDFLHRCFHRKPADRPTARMLLEHPFVKYSHQPDALSCNEVTLMVNYICTLALTFLFVYSHYLCIYYAICMISNRAIHNAIETSRVMNLNKCQCLPTHRS